jgi:signal transduction histidine kinase
VSYTGPADEVGELATTFDYMIEHLDKGFQSQKRFVADASHELRGPLTVISGNLDLLKRKLNEKDRYESEASIRRETTRMSKIVEDLLFLADVESGELAHQQIVALEEILIEERDRAQTIAGDREIIIGQQDKLVIKGDAQKLRQLLSNLIDNAIKYTPEHGTVMLSLFRDGEWARLEVADTGIGIAPESQPHIFDRFYRVDRARSRLSSSTGLGLAIVKGIVDQHGGKVTVSSELGKGSKFTVWLKL